MIHTYMMIMIIIAIVVAIYNGRINNSNVIYLVDADKGFLGPGLL
jgi:hypothetical protein